MIRPLGGCHAQPQNKGPFFIFACFICMAYFAVAAEIALKVLMAFGKAFKGLEVKCFEVLQPTIYKEFMNLHKLFSFMRGTV